MADSLLTRLRAVTVTRNAGDELHRIDAQLAIGEAIRSAEEALRRVAPERANPRVRLDVDEPSLAFELLSGRSGTRIVRIGSKPVHRNGWPLMRNIPAVLLEGDTVSCDGRTYRALAEGDSGRRLLEAGAAMQSAIFTKACEYWFRILPDGALVALMFDTGTVRAVLDVVLGGNGDLAFEAAALCEVDRAVVDWTLRKLIVSVGLGLLGSEVSLSECSPEDAEIDWYAAAVRVGSYPGAVRVGFSVGAARLLAARLPSKARSVSVARLPVVVSVRIPLGKERVGTLGAMTPGDLIVAGVDTWLDSGPRGSGELAVGSAKLGVALETRGRTLIARVLPAPSTSANALRSDEMENERGSEAEWGVLEALGDAAIEVSLELARRTLTLAELFGLSEGDVLEFKSPVRGEVVVLAGGSPIALGEIVDVDGQLGVRITELGRNDEGA